MKTLREAEAELLTQDKWEREQRESDYRKRANRALMQKVLLGPNAKAEERDLWRVEVQTTYLGDWVHLACDYCQTELWQRRSRRLASRVEGMVELLCVACGSAYLVDARVVPQEPPFVW